MRFTLATVIAALPSLAVVAPRPATQKSGTAIPISKRSSSLMTTRPSTSTHSNLMKVHRGLAKFQKNTRASHPSVVTGARKRASAGAALMNDGNELWLDSIFVGTPAFGYSVAFNTGSGHVDVPFQQSFLTFERATSQTIGVATQYSSQFEFPQYPPDGLMGMAFQAIAEHDASPSSRLSSIKVRQTSPYSDSSLQPMSPSCTLVALMWLLFTKPLVVLTHPALSAKAFTPSHAIQCFTFGGTSFPIPTDSFNLGPVYLTSTDCISGIVGQDVGASFWIVGALFLSNVYTAFDVGNTRVGFATLA
ncbi:Asp-domain-containing protein [Melanogaster broomeanus]|nr:Asp-domain-containing protein [Melanogaster broomeanus]